MKSEASFDLTNTYVFLEDGGQAPTIEVDEKFWRELMSGNASSAGARLVAGGLGWLTAIYRLERDTTSWEMHPAGDELLVCLSGAIDIVLEVDGGDRVVELTQGKSCIVPRGVWHKQVVRAAGEELAVTYGRRTQHRPLSA